MPDGVQQVEQVLADPGVDVAQRAPERGVQPVVPPAPARASRRLRRGAAPPAAAAGTCARIQSTEPAEDRRGVVVERGHVVAVPQHDLGRVGAGDAVEQHLAC